MKINRGQIAWVCVVWAFALLLGLAFSLNVPLVLLVIATVLYLFF